MDCESLKPKILKKITEKDIFKLITNEKNNKLIKLILSIDKNIVNYKDKYNNTLLIFASSFNNIDLTKLLLDNGADVNAKDIYGYTSLDYANNIDKYKLLISYGAKE